MEDRVRGKGSFISAVENKQSAVSVSVSFLIFLSFSVYTVAKCPLTQCFDEKRYQRFWCHCNKLLLKNAQLYNKTSCCIATKLRLTILFLSSIFNAWKWNVSKIFRIYLEEFLDFLKLPPSEEAFENHSKFFLINPKNILNVSPSDNKNLAENRNDQAKFRSLCNKIPFLICLFRISNFYVKIIKLCNLWSG